jgi:hypothetical protein
MLLPPTLVRNLDWSARGVLIGGQAPIALCRNFMLHGRGDRRERIFGAASEACKKNIAEEKDTSSDEAEWS